MKKIILGYIRLVRLGIIFSVPVGLATYMFVYCDYIIADLLLYIFSFMLIAGPIYTALSSKLVASRKKTDTQ